MHWLEDFRAIFRELPKQEIVPELYVAFAKFEKCGEMEDVDTFKFALEKIPKEEAKELYREFIAFEKQHGSREGIEDVIMNKRRFQYEAQLKSSPKDYDIWFDYIRLEESVGDHDRIREVYERAIANIPPSQEKKHWRRYIY